MAVGADHVLRLWDDVLGRVRSLRSPQFFWPPRLRTEGLPDLVLCGARTLDRGSGKIPALLGEYLDWPVVTDITSLDIQAARVGFQRRLARGARSEGEVTMPAVLAIETGAVRLRYASLPGLDAGQAGAGSSPPSSGFGTFAADVDFPASTVHVGSPPRPRPARDIHTRW